MISICAKVEAREVQWFADGTPVQESRLHHVSAVRKAQVLLYGIFDGCLALRQLVKTGPLHVLAEDCSDFCLNAKHIPVEARAQQAWEIWLNVVHNYERIYLPPKKRVVVKGYQRDDGKKIASHLRSWPGTKTS